MHLVFINSVTGELNSSQLGYTLVHEHLLIRSESIYYQFPHLYDEKEEYERALKQVFAAKERGVKTICDPTVYGIGRDIRFMEKVAKETGVQIVAATGIYTMDHIPLRFQSRDIEYMTDALVWDIEHGIQNTSIKAGFLKCATDVNGITDDIEKVLRAVARAHHKTGVPIMTHSYPASETGLLQLDIFEDEGVNPKYVMIGHSGDTDNMDYLLKIIDRGAYIGMDRFGMSMPITNEQRTLTVLELLKNGYEDRMFLSHDYCCSLEGKRTEEFFHKYLNKWSMTYLMDEVIPKLLNSGIKESQIHTMMVNNVQRWFEGK